MGNGTTQYDGDKDLVSTVPEDEKHSDCSMTSAEPLAKRPRIEETESSKVKKQAGNVNYDMTCTKISAIFKRTLDESLTQIPFLQDLLNTFSELPDLHMTEDTKKKLMCLQEEVNDTVSDYKRFQVRLTELQSTVEFFDPKILKDKEELPDVKYCGKCLSRLKAKGKKESAILKNEGELTSGDKSVAKKRLALWSDYSLLCVLQDNISQLKKSWSLYMVKWRDIYKKALKSSIPLEKQPVLHSLSNTLFLSSIFLYDAGIGEAMLENLDSSTMVETVKALAKSINAIMTSPEDVAAMIEKAPDLGRLLGDLSKFTHPVISDEIRKEIRMLRAKVYGTAGEYRRLQNLMIELRSRVDLDEGELLEKPTQFYCGGCLCQLKIKRQLDPLPEKLGGLRITDGKSADAKQKASRLDYLRHSVLQDSISDEVSCWYLCMGKWLHIYCELGFDMDLED